MKFYPNLICLIFNWALWVGAVSICQAGTYSLQFQASNFSQFDPLFSNSPPVYLNQRSFVFTPDSDFQYLSYFNLNDLAANGAAIDLFWLESRTNFLDLGNTAIGDASATVDTFLTIACSEGELGSNLDDALTNSFKYDFFDFYDAPIYSGTSDIQMEYLVQGGIASGQTILLTGKCGYEYAIDIQTNEIDGVTGVDEYSITELHAVFNWGIGLDGKPQMIELDFDLSLDAETDDTDILSINGLSQKLLDGYPSPLDYATNIIGYYRTNLTSKLFNLTGAVPELLVLYDFSGSNSISTSKLLQPPDSNESYKSTYGYINQYDAGVAFNLPKRFPIINPKAGGNACGPTSLGMALSINGTPDDPLSLYDNTMQFGLVMTDNFTNAFRWQKAMLWLEGATTPASGEGVNFSSKSPLPLGIKTYGRVADTCTNRFADNWNTIDKILSTKQPVMIRTDLGSLDGTVSNTTGSGHVILLLGTNHSDLVKSVYQLSGDYYIVADPAGHFFANQFAIHYGLVTNLMAQCIGINYGGFFAIYPKELLQSHIKFKPRYPSPMMSFLTFPAPIAYQKAQTKCPVALIVTDPAGRQTGIQTNGSVIEDIPESWYEPDVIDEEEDGLTSFLTNCIETVIVDDPLAGTYQAEVVGTGDGAFEFDWSDVAIGGKQFYQSETTNSITAGQTFVYQHLDELSPPQLQISSIDNNVVISWPTNATGFYLESSPSLLPTATWSSGLSSTVIGVNYIVTNSISASAQFYRLISQ